MLKIENIAQILGDDPFSFKKKKRKYTCSLIYCCLIYFSFNIDFFVIYKSVILEVFKV